MSDHTRFAWARLNADTLFLALLAFAAGAFDLADPARDAVAAVVLREVGVIGTLFYARAGAYTLAGALLALALLRSSLRIEVIARSVLIGGVALNVYRHTIWFGWDTPTTSQVVLLVLVVLTTALRLSVLLGGKGLVVSRPAALGGKR